MSAATTYTKARANLKNLLDRVADSREPVYIQRRGREDVALVAGDELRSLLETAHLLRSPKNAERLLRALTRARAKGGRGGSIERLRKEFGLEHA